MDTTWSDCVNIGTVCDKCWRNPLFESWRTGKISSKEYQLIYLGNSVKTALGKVVVYLQKSVVEG